MSLLASVDGYDIDIVVQGFPGKSVCHGGLGWSTVVLMRGHGRIALIDAGNFGMRKLLIERLEGARPQAGRRHRSAADALALRSLRQLDAFKHARIVIGATELAWSLKEPWGETPVPELYMREARDAGRRWRTVEDGGEALPGITAHIAPGHTPGCLVYVLRGRDRDVIFTGDAAKNRAELVSRDTDMTYDRRLSRASIDMIWELWRRRARLDPGAGPRPADDAGERRHHLHRQTRGRHYRLVRRRHGKDHADLADGPIIPRAHRR